MTAVNLLRLAAIATLLTAGLSGQQAAQPHAEDCLGCHDPGPRAGKRQAGVPPGFHAAALKASPHAALDCVACHSDIKEVPHPEKLTPVNCGQCHSEEQSQYAASVHGKKAAQNDPYAPNCKLCHGTHDILPPSDMKSPVATINVPRLCGSCHSEGTEVSKTRAISQTNISENYKDSIHGIGLFKQGLTVTAVCTSCHTAHNQLPHTDPRSSIAKQNIARTCMKCHAKIEDVHRQVIRGELWEKQPHMIPACVDCHEPHKIRKVYYTEGMSNGDCLSCHSNPNLKGTGSGQSKSLYVSADELARSRHLRIACVQCHTGGTPSDVRACDTIKDKVDCSICHDKEVGQYRESTHGTLAAPLRGLPQPARHSWQAQFRRSYVFAQRPRPVR